MRFTVHVVSVSRNPAPWEWRTWLHTVLCMPGQALPRGCGNNAIRTGPTQGVWQEHYQDRPLQGGVAIKVNMNILVYYSYSSTTEMMMQSGSKVGNKPARAVGQVSEHTWLFKTKLTYKGYKVEIRNLKNAYF